MRVDEGGDQGMSGDEGENEGVKVEGGGWMNYGMGEGVKEGWK